MLATAKRSVSMTNFWCDVAVDAEQADRGGDGGLRVRAARSAAAPASDLERALVAELPEREHRVVLQRAIELRDLGDRREGIGRAVVAERVDHGAAIEILAAHHERRQRLLHLRLVAVGGERAGQRRADELAVFLVERLQQPRRHAAFAVVLEVGVGDGAQPIVRIVERGAHHLTRRAGR